jgi:hypothetical protein
MGLLLLKTTMALNTAAATAAAIAATPCWISHTDQALLLVHTQDVAQVPVVDIPVWVIDQVDHSVAFTPHCSGHAVCSTVMLLGVHFQLAGGLWVQQGL